MIARLWRGWTTRANAGAYERHLAQATLPALERIAGYRDAYVLRRNLGGDVEFVVVTLWESLEAVRRFAGDDYEVAVVPLEARAVLSRFEEHVRHYNVVPVNHE
jgi:heme-degrading monooxygenase HmoA